MTAEGELSLRTSHRGGDRRSEVLVLRRPPPADVWVVFVHGFNVPVKKARRQLGLLRKHALPREQAWPRSVAWVLLLWPSDLWGNSVLDKITYPKVLERVGPVGNLLGEHLAKVSAARIVLVGHSLGAQVALHAAGRMAQRGRAPDGLALLAAAVQTSDVELAGVFGLTFDREAVTVNPRDDVLSRVFLLGEQAARPFWAATPAVGLTGDPPSREWARVRLAGTAHDVYRDRRSIDAVGAVAALPRQPAEHHPDRHEVGAREVGGRS